MAKLQGTFGTRQGREILRREAASVVTVSHESEIGLMSATPPELVRLILEFGEWVIKAGAGGMIGAAAWEYRKVVLDSAKSAIVEPLRTLTMALQSSREASPPHATFAVGIETPYGPEVLVHLPLDDELRTIEVLFLLHCHRAAIENILREWHDRKWHWAMASASFNEDGSGQLFLLKTGDVRATQIPLPADHEDDRDAS